MPATTTLSAADRLLSFYKDSELLARSGTLASVKSFGSQASPAQSMGIGGSGNDRPGSRGRPDANDVIIDPYELNSSDLESSSDSEFESYVGRNDLSEPGEETDWTASGYGDSDDAYDADDPTRPAGGAGGGGGRSVTPSRQLRGGGSRLHLAIAGAAGGGDAISRGSSFAGTRDAISGRPRTNSFRNRVSLAGGSTAAARPAGLPSNLTSPRSLRGGGGGGSSSGGGLVFVKRDLINIRRSAGTVAASAAGTTRESFKSGTSSARGRRATLAARAAAAATAPASGRVTVSSFKSIANSSPGGVQKGSVWTRALKTAGDDAAGGGGGGTAAGPASPLRTDNNGTPPMSSVAGSGISRFTLAQGGITAMMAAAKNRLSGKIVRRRLLRRRGWDFDVTPGEIDFHLGRPLPQALTRPQPTVNSEDEEESEGNGDGDGDNDDGSLAGGAEPPPGPAMESIKTYAKERAPEVLWSERLRSAKLMARSTGQTVTVKGRMDRKRRRDLARKIQKWDNREWFATRKRTPPAPPLHPAVARVIEQWFALVDDDGSGTLDHSELLGALRASKVPVSSDNINEMIELMDMDGDGAINWKEFETFFMYEFAAGKNLLSGEYVLPSGVALPFGAMIAKLKRNKLLTDLTQGGTARAKWMQVAENPIHLEDELGMMAAVEMAMEEMRNPVLARQRLRAAKALARLPPHLRTKSMGRHLERHPEITEKLLRANSIAPYLATSMKRCASTTSQVMARLASAGSQGSAGSSAAPSVTSTSVGSSGQGNNGQKSGRARNVDLNVAAALAAGLEWPVNGANFYNRRARTILRAVCQKPAESLLHSRAAAAKLAAVKAAVGSGGPEDGTAATANAGGAAKIRSPPTAAGNSDSDEGSPVGRRGGGKGAAAAADPRAMFAAGAGSRRMQSLRNSMRFSRSRSKKKNSDDDDDDNRNDEESKRRRSDSSSDSVLPWLVNAKRREEEERERLRAQLQRGDGGGANTSSGDEDDNDCVPGGGGDDDEDVWVSPMLRNWLRQEHKLYRKRRASLLSKLAEPDPGDGGGEPATVDAIAAVKASDGGDSGYSSDSGGAAVTSRMSPYSKGGAGSLARMLLERSVHLPPAVAAIRDAATATAAATAAAVKDSLPPPPQGIRSANTTDSGFTTNSGDVVVVATAAAAAAASPGPATPSRLMPPPLAIENSWGPSLDTPPGGSAFGAGGLGTPIGESPWASGLPSATPMEGKPRKPRRRMRFEDEEKAEPADADSPAVAAAAGSTLEASNQSILTPILASASRSGGGGDSNAKASSPAFVMYSSGTIANGGAAAAGGETSTEDGEGYGSGRNSPGPVAAGRAAFLRSNLVSGDLSGAESSRTSEVSESTATASAAGGPARSPHGLRPRLSILGVQELPMPNAGGVRYWSSVPGGAPPAPLLRTNNPLTSIGGGPHDDTETRGVRRSYVVDPALRESEDEPLDAEEARDLMAALTLVIPKDETLYDIHNGHLIERPSTSHFRAALAKIRTEASALLQSHSLPPHPEYGNGSAAAAAITVHPRPHSPSSIASPFAARLQGANAAAAAPVQMARSHMSTSSGGGAAGVADATGGHRAGNTQGRGSRSVKQVANRHRSLLINGVHMRLSTTSGGGAGGGPSVTARQRRPSLPSSKLPLSQQPSSVRAPSDTSIGFPHNPGLFGANSESTVGDGGGDSNWLITAQKGGDQSHSLVAAAAAMAAEGESPSLDVSAAVLRVPDGGILMAAIDTARSISRSRSPSRCRSPVSRSPAASRPMSRVGSPMRPRSGGGPGPAALCPTAQSPPPPPLSQLPLAPTGSGAIASDASYVTGGSGAATARGGPRGRTSPVPMPIPQLPEAWGAHVASMFQWRTEAELAAVQRIHKSVYTPRESTSSPLRAASPESGARRRTGGSSSNPQSSSSTGGGDGGPAPGSAVAALANALLGPAGTTLPDFVPVPGAGPRLQSRYAARRSVTTELATAPLPPPGEAAAQVVPGRMATDFTGYGTGSSSYAEKDADPGGSGANMETEEFLPTSTERATIPRVLDVDIDANGTWEGHQDMDALAISPAAPSAPAVGPRLVYEELVLRGGGRSSLTSTDAVMESAEVLTSDTMEAEAQAARAVVRSISTKDSDVGAAAAAYQNADMAPAAAMDRSQSAAGLMAAAATGMATVEMTSAPAGDAAVVGIEAAAPPAPAPPLLPSLTEDAAKCGTNVSVPDAADAASGDDTSAETAPAAAGRLLPLHLRRFTLSTEGSEPASHAANSDYAEDNSPRTNEMASRPSSLLLAQPSLQQPPLPPPSAPLAAPDPDGHIDGDDAMVPPLAMEATRTTNGRRLTIDEALLLSGFGKPQTPALARIERATSRVQNPCLSTSRHTVMIDHQTALSSCEPPAPAAAATTVASLSTVNVHSGGGAAGAGMGSSGGGAAAAVHPNGFTLPAPSRLKLTVPPLQLTNQHHLHIPPPLPAGMVTAAAPPLQLHGVQKLLSGPLSPRSLAATTARGSGSGSQASDTASMAAHGRSMGGGGSGAATTITTTTTTATVTTTAATAAQALSGRSKLPLQSMALVSQLITAAGGESLEGGVSGSAGDVVGSLSPTMVAVASVPLPPVQAARSQSQLPLIHQVHTFPMHSQLQSFNPVYHLQNPHQQQSSGGGAAGGMAGVSVNGVSISGTTSCGGAGSGGSGVRVPQLQIQLPPLRDPGSPRRCDSPRPAAPATVPPPPPGHKYGESLSDGAAAAAVLASASALASVAAGQKDSSKVRRGRSELASSLPALPARVQSQGNLAAGHVNPSKVASGETSSCGGAGVGASAGATCHWTARAAPPRALSGSTTFVGERTVSLPPPPEHSPQPASAVHRRAAWTAEPSSASASVSVVAISPPLAMMVPTSSTAAATAASAATSAAAAFAPAPPAAPLVAPVTSSITDLPDIVTLLMHETRSPIRTGPTRVRKMDY